MDNTLEKLKAVREALRPRLEEMCNAGATLDLLIAERQQPASSLVEAAAKAIYRNNPATSNGIAMSWEDCAEAFPERIAECTEDAEAAIAILR